MNKVLQVFNLLFRKYDSQGWWPVNNKYNPNFKTKEKSEAEKFEICVGAILTQSTSWRNVEKALNTLRKNNALNKKTIKKLSTEKLALLIKSSGYHNQKARKLKEFVNFNKEFSRENLLSVWGLGPETVDSILLYAYDKPFFVVDLFTKRIFSRLGLVSGNKYDVFQDFFHKNLPEDSKLFNEYHALIVEHSKRFCKKVPECCDCPLKKFCYIEFKLKPTNLVVGCAERIGDIMNLVDVHCHLTHERFKADIPKVVADSEKAGVKAVLVSGVNPEDNKKVLELAKKFDILKASPCLLYTSPSPRDRTRSRMPSSA